MIEPDKQRLLFIGLAAALIVTIGVAALLIRAGGPEPAPSPSLEGKAAPDMVFLADGNLPVSIKDFRGRIVLLYLFSGSCPTCRKSLPGLWELQKGWNSKGMTLLMIDVDPPEIVSYSPSLPKDSWIYLARDNEQKATGIFGVKLLPTSYLMDRDGMVLDIFVGVHRFDGPAIRKRIEKYLG